MRQVEMARLVTDNMECDGHEIDADDLLDYLGIAGLQLVEGDAASEEYVDRLVNAVKR